MRGGTLVEGYDRDFSPITTVTTEWLDPAHVALLEPLTRPNPQGVETAVLASTWTYNSDRTLWTFQLRDGLKFHSGASCTNESVVAAYNAFRAKTGGLPFWWNRVSNVEAASGNKVVVTCNESYGPFLDVLVQQMESNILNMATMNAAGSNYGVTVVDGTGPFKLSQFVPGSHVLVERWDGYAGLPSGAWLNNKGAAYLDAIRWVPIINAPDRADQILSGNVHIVKNPLFQDIPKLKANPNITVYELPGPNAMIFGLVQTKTNLGFDDLRVRQAISQAIDRSGLVKSILLGHGAPTYGPLPPNDPLYTSQVEQFNQYNVAQANSLLDSAGWVKGSDGIRAKNGNKLAFTIANEQDTTKDLIAQALVPMLAAVGVSASIKTYEQAAFIPALSTCEAFLFQWLWSPPIAQQNTLAASQFRPIPDWAMADIPAVDTAFSDWFSATSQSALTAAAQQIQLTMAQNLPFLTLYAPNEVWAVSNKVHGWAPNYTNLYPYYQDVWLEA